MLAYVLKLTLEEVQKVISFQNHAVIISLHCPFPQDITQIFCLVTA